MYISVLIWESWDSCPLFLGILVHFSGNGSWGGLFFMVVIFLNRRLSLSSSKVHILKSAWVVYFHVSRVICRSCQFCPNTSDKQIPRQRRIKWESQTTCWVNRENSCKTCKSLMFTAKCLLWSLILVVLQPAARVFLKSKTKQLRPALNYV